MTKNEIETIVNAQREYFFSYETLDVKKRKFYLEKLKNEIISRKEEICVAIKKDLGKSYRESYMCEVALTLSEIDFLLKNLNKLTKKQRVKTPIAQFSAKSYRLASPYGVVLIMSPWNYPFLLSFDPLVEALAAGNTVVLKPSNYSPYTDEVMIDIISKVFPKKLVAVVTGGRNENEALLDIRFDYIFFTGSKTVGKLVYLKASEYLTPVTLELGGKSPCIVDCDAEIALTAKRIVFGKFLNCGQTCVAPDYVIVNEKVKDKLLSEIKKQIVLQFTDNPIDNEDYGKIITERHYERLKGLINKEKLYHGGKFDDNKLKIEPTVIADASYSDECMKDEIFGPILPVMTFKTIDEVIKRINESASPLALYIFTENAKTADKVMKTCRFGGGCVNDVVIHLATSYMPFGGFGESGMGSYHGVKGFETFSHYKSIVDKSTKIDLKLRYQPYKKSDDKIIETFMK